VTGSGGSHATVSQVSQCLAMCLFDELIASGAQRANSCGYKNPPHPLTKELRPGSCHSQPTGDGGFDCRISDGLPVMPHLSSQPAPAVRASSVEFRHRSSAAR
jgi:hypothetical protein